MHKEQIILLTDPVYSWEAEKEYIWQDDAACAFSPPTMFEVAVPSDDVAAGDGVNEVHDLNEVNLRAAQRICGKCPVFDQCYISATPDDFRWTMRAGVMPTAHVVTPLGRPSKGRQRQEVCSQGHDDWTTQINGKRYCNPCKKVAQDAANAKRSPSGGKLRLIVPGVERDKPCRNDHNEWKLKVPTKPKAGWYCVICRRTRETVKRRESREAAKLVK